LMPLATSRRIPRRPASRRRRTVLADAVSRARTIGVLLGNYVRYVDPRRGLARADNTSAMVTLCNVFPVLPRARGRRESNGSGYLVTGFAGLGRGGKIATPSLAAPPLPVLPPPLATASARAWA
jgi:hypothetical protein